MSNYITEDIIKYNLENLPQVVFEVTDSCNLHCKYCGYSEFYLGYDERRNKKMNFEMAKQVLDFLFAIWKEQNCNDKVVKPVSIGFYGGEPLLNMDLIERVVEYVEDASDLGKSFVFNMTSNAVLLHKYADYLAQHKFRLMISLDGDSYGHSYRVDHLGNNSFQKVYQNVHYLKSHYPDYFNRFVTFNAVLHNRNSVESIYHFIKDNFGKEPHISQLNSSGIRPDQINAFNAAFRNYSQSINDAPNCDALKTELFIKNPDTMWLLDFLHKESGNVFSDYNSLLFRITESSKPTTGTCLPFQKKMFVTVNGKILPCERINHEFSMGIVNENGVQIDSHKIVDNFNRLIAKIVNQCAVCGYKNSCTQCLYQIDCIDSLPQPRCPRCSTISVVEKRKCANLLYLRKNPELYMKLLNNAILRG